MKTYLLIFLLIFLAGCAAQTPTGVEEEPADDNFYYAPFLPEQFVTFLDEPYSYSVYGEGEIPEEMIAKTNNVLPEGLALQKNGLITGVPKELYDSDIRVCFTVNDKEIGCQTTRFIVAKKPQITVDSVECKYDSTSDNWYKYIVMIKGRADGPRDVVLNYEDSFSELKQKYPDKAMYTDYLMKGRVENVPESEKLKVFSSCGGWKNSYHEQILIRCTNELAFPTNWRVGYIISAQELPSLKYGYRLYFTPDYLSNNVTASGEVICRK